MTTLKHKLAIILILIPLVLLLISQILFPGRQSLLAITLATGFGTEDLQKKVDLMEAKAIQGKPFSEGEKEFLYDLYKTMASGGKLIPLTRQTGLMMDHYLSKTGSNLKIASSIYVKNRKVQKRMEQIRKRIRNSEFKRKKFESEIFYMPDASSIDSLFGLYWGKVIAYPEYTNSGITIRWRAEVPWEWPSYQSLKNKYGSYDAESFPLPNMKSIFVGVKHSLYVDNGLGEYLTRIGVAKSFLAYAEWTEEM